MGAVSSSGRSYDGVYRTVRSKRRMKACHRCEVAFRDGDKIHVSAGRKRKRHIYHKTCWESLFI